MRASLVQLYKRFYKETASLSETVQTNNPLHQPQGTDLLDKNPQYVCEMCVIRLHDAWARFCRELVVMSAYAEPLTGQGGRVPRAPGIRDRRHVIPTLLATYKKRTEEPNWHIPGDSLDAARRLNVQNYQSIAGGIGRSLPRSPTDQLREARNFFAHRNDDTAIRLRQVARNLGLSNLRQPYLLMVFPGAPGVSVFDLWVSQLRTMASVAVQ